ncbi:MAG: hypothetical protein AAGD06_11760, partial [Acidobacteriota bacterium]
MSAPLDILLATHGLPVAAEDPVDQALGGSETAVLSMAAALARRGHRVAVGCRVDGATRYGEVELLPWETLAAHTGRSWELAIVARSFELLSKAAPKAGMTALWHHDMPQAGRLDSVRGAMAQAELSFFLSRFHLESFKPHIHGIEDHAVLTTNGVDFAAAGAIRSGAEPPRRPEFLFASRPERGLETLLRDLWPRILNRLPDARLRVTSYAVPTDLPPAARAAHRRCRDLVRRTPAVHGIGPLRRREFWRHLASSSALLYPTDFPETNCMVALEA